MIQHSCSARVQCPMSAFGSQASVVKQTLYKPTNFTNKRPTDLSLTIDKSKSTNRVLQSLITANNNKVNDQSY